MVRRGNPKAVKASLLLVVALELLGLVVAVGLALPWAVEHTVRLGHRTPVERVVPGRLTFAAESARAEGGVWQGKSILSHGGNVIALEVLGRSGILGAIQLPRHPVVAERVRDCPQERTVSAAAQLTWVIDRADPAS